MMNSSKSKEAHQLESEAKKKIKSGDSRSKDAANDLLEGPQLGVDELCLIFENYWISAGDLLSCRMVNKNWRDAATTTLLKRDACCVKIYFEDKTHPSTGRLPYSHMLSQLTELISNSPKFLTSNFSIYNFSKSDSDNNGFQSLYQFFEKHGDKIKTLCLHFWTTRKFLNDILFKFTPNLQCLDLSRGKFWSSEGVGDKSEPQVLPITSLWLGDFWKDNYYPGISPNDDPGHNDIGNATDEYPIVHWLLSSSLKLTCIHNVTLDTLGGVLREGKGHLIRSFNYSSCESLNPSSLQIMAKFMALKPKLSTAKLDMTYNDWKWGGDAPLLMHQTKYITLVNAFIDSFKDTVQDLTFSFIHEAHAWNSKVKIPPMKKLRSMTVDGIALKNSTPIGGLFDLHLNFIQFNDGISAQNYFPNLRKMSLRYQGHSSHTEEANLMSFFAFKSERDDGLVWDSLPNVDTLETDWEVISCLHAYKGVPENTLLPEMFPNIRFLKIKCDELFHLETLCWIICPKVEFMEIYGIESVRTGFKNDRDFAMSNYVDMWFTGFPLEICQKLRTTQLPDQTNYYLDMLKFLPLKPSVSHLRRKQAFC